MNRRDIIIVAVLINAGLLIALFSSALKTTPGETTLVKEVPQVAALPKKEIRQETVLPKAEILPQATAKSVVSSFIDEKPYFEVEKKEIKPAPVVAAVMPLISKDNNYIEVQVKKGDMLDKIAKTYNTSTDAIIELNHLSSTRLNIGQVLKVPTSDKVKKEEAMPTEEEHKYYVVKNGDNPWTIAVKNHIKFEELLELNHLDEGKARRLKPGDRLRIK